MAEDEYAFDDWDEESERIAVELENRQSTSIPVESRETGVPATGNSSTSGLNVIAEEEKEIEALLEDENRIVVKKDSRSLWYVLRLRRSGTTC